MTTFTGEDTLIALGGQPTRRSWSSGAASEVSKIGLGGQQGRRLDTGGSGDGHSGSRSTVGAQWGRGHSGDPLCTFLKKSWEKACRNQKFFVPLHQDAKPAGKSRIPAADGASAAEVNETSGTMRTAEANETSGAMRNENTQPILLNLSQF